MKLSAINRIIILICFSIIINNNSLQSQARIDVGELNNIKGEVSPLIFGNFFEFLQNFMNGPFEKTLSVVVPSNSKLMQIDTSHLPTGLYIAYL